MTSQLKLLREEFRPNDTIGRLLVGGTFECYTLEDAYRPIKIPGETCIPYGAYEIAIIWSDHYRRVMPYLLRVPNFDQVMIHTGNTDADTKACILVGQQRGVDLITQSLLAFDALYPKILALCQSQHTYIDVTRE